MLRGVGIVEVVIISVDGESHVVIGKLDALDNYDLARVRQENAMGGNMCIILRPEDLAGVEDLTTGDFDVVECTEVTAIAPAEEEE